MKIAICVVCYNRPDSLKRVLSSLEKAYYDEPVTLIISIDKSKTTAVEELADQYKWEHGELRVIKHKENLGLRKHILSIGDFLKHDYEAVVVLEDDITVSPNFMRCTRQCVEKYCNDDRIAGISLYKSVINSNSRMPFHPLKNEYDVFFVKYAMSWGQVWMRKQWLAFKKWYDMNSKPFCLNYLPRNINQWSDKSWLKYHIRYCLECDKFFVFPYDSHSTNNDDTGTHITMQRTINQTMMVDYPKLHYCLPSFDEQHIKYDTFFDPLFLAKHLGVNDKELTVDLFGQKHESTYHRYVLSLQALPYEIIDSYALRLKPLEQNIIQKIIGDGIFLYDTNIKST